MTSTLWRGLAFAGVTWALTGCATQIQSQLQEATGPAVFRFVTDDPVVSDRCKNEVATTYCGHATTNAASTRCILKLPSGMAAHRCTIFFDEACWTFQETGERCYRDRQECERPVAGTCNFYTDCLEKYTPCGLSGYARSYGLKYCYAFRELDVGQGTSLDAWREVTMACLQKQLVGLTQADQNLDCAAITDLAFDSHPDCYTTPGSSVCDLSLSDTRMVVATVERRDLMSLRSAKQMLTVARRCISALAGGIFRLQPLDTLDQHRLQDDERSQKLALWQEKLREWEEYVSRGEEE